MGKGSTMKQKITIVICCSELVFKSITEHIRSLKFIEKIYHVHNIKELKQFISKNKDVFVILQESKIKDIRCIKELKERLESLKQ